MKLSETIAIWDALHIKDTGELGYNDLEGAIGKVVGIENDIDNCQPQQPSPTNLPSLQQQ